MGLINSLFQKYTYLLHILTFGAEGLYIHTDPEQQTDGMSKHGDLTLITTKTPASTAAVTNVCAVLDLYRSISSDVASVRVYVGKVVCGRLILFVMGELYPSLNSMFKCLLRRFS